MENTKLYLVVRGDLKPGDQIAQSNHASLHFALAYPELTRQWSDASNNIAVLAARDERHLALLLSRATELADISAVSFREPDLNNEMTAIGLHGPQLHRLLSSLPKALKIGARGMMRHLEWRIDSALPAAAVAPQQ